MAEEEKTRPSEAADEELDEWDQRIFSTGCSAEQLRMNDCYYEKKDWRACKNETVLEEEWKRAADTKQNVLSASLSTVMVIIEAFQLQEPLLLLPVPAEIRACLSTRGSRVLV
ncbi:uncharacterized protein A1O9_04605 [Exophiala aquamarina CBS 119918]|uniref:Uncharacterized protein n=1 Tax=Exophiala aquamarina CBS 119918 TaxID=1182545 RepID=A0A072PJ68_9EURO|nr:uncharacterized protein A1O9_04605 [Exophiala aquamarina CBS 119918]KEF59757.1 hypothetical protein A1O9_04605 [Exophiala aquamarina CBS 119918]